MIPFLFKVKRADEVWAQVRAQVWDQVRDQVREQVRDQVGEQVRAQVRAQVWDQVCEQVRDQVWEQVWAQVRAQVWEQVGEQVGDQVWEQVGEQVGDQVWEQVGEQVGDQVRAQVRAQAFGSHDSSWLSLYECFGVVCGLQVVDRLSGLIGLAKHCGWWAPYSTVCFLQDRPAKIHLVDGRLHCDGGPSISYRDGFCVYSLNGVRVPDWLAIQRSGEIDPTRITEIKNAEIRREFVRKVGLERIRHKLEAELLDEKKVVLQTLYDDAWECTYRLEELHFGEGVRRRVLIMPNASLEGVTHVEYVPMECDTVEQAMNFRIGRQEKADEDGADWYLHGDVVIKPKGATSLKQWPALIA